jgi:predicted TIM-barrel fold metal-dependent hydrolase
MVIDSANRELSYAATYRAARLAVRVHLQCDGEEPPLRIVAPDERVIATAVLDHCGNVVIKTNTLAKKYETEVLNNHVR